jgi:hypothetical protein
MATRKKKVKPSKETPKVKAGCYCGSCELPYPQLRGYILAAIGITFLPLTMGAVPGFIWFTKGWPILLILFGLVLMTKAAICKQKK